VITLEALRAALDRSTDVPMPIAAHKRILSPGTLLVEGLRGAGKSWLIQHLISLDPNEPPGPRFGATPLPGVTTFVLADPLPAVEARRSRLRRPPVLAHRRHAHAARHNTGRHARAPRRGADDRARVGVVHHPPSGAPGPQRIRHAPVRRAHRSGRGAARPVARADAPVPPPLRAGLPTPRHAHPRHTQGRPGPTPRNDLARLVGAGAGSTARGAPPQSRAP
jgi:hypothetical protein